MVKSKMRSATLWGKDKNDELICPVIFLWKNKKGTMKADDLGGALEHGTQVIVRDDNDGWFKVHKNIIFEGKSYPQVGYVYKTLVRFDD